MRCLKINISPSNGRWWQQKIDIDEGIIIIRGQMYWNERWLVFIEIWYIIYMKKIHDTNNHYEREILKKITNLFSCVIKIKHDKNIQYNRMKNFGQYLYEETTNVPHVCAQHETAMTASEWRKFANMAARGIPRDTRNERKTRLRIFIAAKARKGSTMGQVWRQKQNSKTSEACEALDRPLETRRAIKAARDDPYLFLAAKMLKTQSRLGENGLLDEERLFSNTLLSLGCLVPCETYIRASDYRTASRIRNVNLLRFDRLRNDECDPMTLN